MLSALYTEAAAITAANKQHEAIAANLANLQTPGYKSRIPSFESLLPPPPSRGAVMGRLTSMRENVNSKDILSALSLPSARESTDFSRGIIESSGDGRRGDLGGRNRIMSPNLITCCPQ